ncbi:highly divergent homeobox-like [Tupaia chinensis]|uniref:highly divergent homeobox-like n=1 Tax=Tupaia chinensis TaxID=246437 RepID=UPI0003C8DBD6|nr:highly divergent homeobox-like [Tupaia chinensis]
MAEKSRSVILGKAVHVQDTCSEEEIFLLLAPCQFPCFSVGGRAGIHSESLGLKVSVERFYWFSLLDGELGVGESSKPHQHQAADSSIFVQLQDRTQFSDRDLATLKKYWDNGMTSLGSVCREKIEAVATELNVDCEIVRTWIGNRRRKYRLMGIEVPPPRGGPADFSEQPESGSLSALTPGEEAGEDNDRNDEVSICLSEGSSQEEPNEVVPNHARAHKEEDHQPISTDNVKIEIIDDEESDMISNSEVEQVNSLLEYKNEEVRFIENELEIQKQKYFKLQTFVRSLILAMKADDKEQQQALLSDLPPELEEMDFNHASPEPDDTSFSVSSLSEKNASDSL